MGGPSRTVAPRRRAREPAELIARRQRTAMYAAVLGVVGLGAMMVVKALGGAIPMGWIALGIATGSALGLALLTPRWPDLTRRLLPFAIAATLVAFEREPFVTDHASAAVFLPMLFAAVLAEELFVIAALTVTVVGLGLRGGAGSPYLTVEFLPLAVLSGALVVYAQRTVLNVFARLAAVERGNSAIVATTDDILTVARLDRGARLRSATVNDAVVRVLGYSAAEFVGLCGPFDVTWREALSTNSAPSLAIDSGTRELAMAESAKIVGRLAPLLHEGTIAYKKVDSLLRGAWAAELGTCLRSGHWASCVVASSMRRASSAIRSIGLRPRSSPSGARAPGTRAT